MDSMIKQLFISTAVKDLPYTQQIRSALNGLTPKYFSPEELCNIKANFDRQDVLIITSLQGELLKDCPGTTKYSCCGYKILNVGLNCLFNCSYCILQDYLQSKQQVVFADIEEQLAKLAPKIQLMKQSRIGTGEFTDSLILDHLTSLSVKLVNYFRHQKNILLELKTKSTNIENLLSIEATTNTVVSWSINPQNIMNVLEKGTPSLRERLSAASKVAQHGYSVAFHFDPMVLYETYAQDYTKVVEAIFAHVPKESIKWISLGTLRFTKGLKPLFMKRSPLFIDEFIAGDDNKFRYLRQRRVKAYALMLEQIRKYSSDTFVYLCMESQAVWEEVFGFHFSDNTDFEKYFNSKVF